jgi:hypothetical protein
LPTAAFLLLTIALEQTLWRRTVAEDFVVVKLWGKDFKVQVHPNYLANFHIALNADDTERLFGHVVRQANGLVLFGFTHSALVNPESGKWKKKNQKLQVRANQPGAEKDLYAWLRARGLEQHVSGVAEAVKALTQPLLPYLQ